MKITKLLRFRFFELASVSSVEGADHEQHHEKKSVLKKVKAKAKKIKETLTKHGHGHDHDDEEDNEEEEMEEDPEVHGAPSMLFFTNPIVFCDYIKLTIGLVDFSIC